MRHIRCDKAQNQSNDSPNGILFIEIGTNEDTVLVFLTLCMLGNFVC